MLFVLFYFFTAVLITLLPIMLAKGKYGNLYVISWINIWYIFLPIMYFWIYKYSGVDLLIFPDENTYLLTDHISPYAIFVRYVADTFPIYILRIIQYVILSLSILYFITKLKANFNHLLGYLFLPIIMFVLVYWSFFILKEAYTVSGLLFYILFLEFHRFKYFLLASILILFSRPEILIILVTGELFIYLYRAYKLTFYFLLTSMLFGIKLFLDNPISSVIKLFIVSRGTVDGVKAFTPNVTEASQLDAYNFLISSEYITTIINGILRSFTPFVGALSVSIFTLVNLFGYFIVFKILTKKRRTRALLMITIIILFTISTHSVSRYINSFLLPFVIYALAITNQNKINFQRN